MLEKQMAWKSDPCCRFVQFLWRGCVALWGRVVPSSPASLPGVRVFLCQRTLHLLSVGVRQRGRLWRWFGWGLSSHLLPGAVQMCQQPEVIPDPQLKQSFWHQHVKTQPRKGCLIGDLFSFFFCSQFEPGQVKTAILRVLGAARLVTMTNSAGR